VTPESQAKFDIATVALESGILFIVLDARVEGVVVPEAHTLNNGLTLEIGHNMLVPIPDLELGEIGIFGTLSFGRTPFYVTIPWEAIYGLHVRYDQPRIRSTEKVPEPTPEERRKHLKLLD